MQSPLTSNSLQPVLNIQASFGGGMRDRDHPSLLEANEYAYGKNLELRNAGLAKTRRGYVKKSNPIGANPQGAYFFQPSGTTGYIVVVNGGRIYTWQSGSLTVTQLGVTVLNNVSTNVEICAINGRMFIFSGAADHVYSWDGIAAALTDEGNGNTDPPLGNICCQQSGRIFGSGVTATAGITNARDYYFPSSVFDGQTYNLSANNQRTPTDGSEPITSLGSYRKQQILAFTRNSSHIWDVGGSDVTAFSRDSIDPEVGNIAHRSLKVIGEDAFFMSADRQIRTIKRTIVDVASWVSVPVTYFVPNLMDRVTEAYASVSAAVIFDNYYLISVPLDGSTYNNAVIPFDLLHQRAAISGSMPVCVGEWTNIQANQWIVSNFSNKHELYFIDSVDGSINRMFDGSTDNGANIDVEIKTRGFDLNNPQVDKTSHSSEVLVFDSLGNLSIYFAKDDGNFSLIKTVSLGDMTSAILPISLNFNLPGATGIGAVPVPMYRLGRSRYWQLGFNFSGDRVNIKQFLIRGWAEGALTR